MKKNHADKSKQTQQLDSKSIEKLAHYVQSLYQEALSEKTKINLMGKSIREWEERLKRAYHKEHEMEELESRENMASYFGLIQIKTNTSTSFLKSKYISFKNFPFSLEPSPIVDLPQEQKEKGFKIVVSKLLDVLMQNGLPPESIIGENGLIRKEVIKFIEKEARQAKSSLIDEELKIAKESAIEMTRHIQEQFVNACFEEAFSEFIFNLTLYPFAVLSFDFVETVKNKWNGNKFIKEKKVLPKFRAINPKNCYPSPDFKGGEGSYFIEKVSRTRAELISLLSLEEQGFRKEAIKEILEECQESDEEGNKKGYISLKCQCKVNGLDLIEYGIETENEYQLFDVDIEVLQDKVIYIQLNQSPHGRKTYFITSYKKISGNMAGISPAMMIYDRQLSINRIQYAMAVNAFYSSGPMLEMNTSAFDNPNDVQFLPYSVSLSNPEKQNTGLTLHQISPIFGHLFNQMVNEIRLADDECGLPSFLNGNAGLQGAGRTLGGLAIMQDNAVLGLKDCFANIDMYIIRPIVEMFRDMNLEDGESKGLRGDSEVIATGILGLEQDLAKVNAMAGLMPTMGAFTQQGVVPQEMYRDYAMDFLKSQGIDTSKYNFTPSPSGEIGNMANSAVPSQTSQLDGRSL